MYALTQCRATLQPSGGASGLFGRLELGWSWACRRPGASERPGGSPGPTLKRFYFSVFAAS